MTSQLISQMSSMPLGEVLLSALGAGVFLGVCVGVMCAAVFFLFRTTEKLDRLVRGSEAGRE
jgi:cytosine/uracil/thiamine/allantoin permease